MDQHPHPTSQDAARQGQVPVGAADAPARRESGGAPVEVPADGSLRADVARWVARRTWRASDVDPADLRRRRSDRGLRVDLVVPARDEEATVGRLLRSLLGDDATAAGLVDDVVVVDDGSTDATAEVARAAGARVVPIDRDRTDDGSGGLPGKGGALRAGLAACDGDLVLFCDADVTDAGPAFVAGLLAPLLADPDDDGAVEYVKAFYRRPLDGLPGGGGRVTELVARPLLALHEPGLTGVVQPLAGEQSGTRALLESLSLASGYAVELGLLLDAHAAVGPRGLAQVDLGVRSHRHGDLARLGRMALEQHLVLAGRGGGTTAGSPAAGLVQFVAGEHGWHAQPHDVAVRRAPPLRPRPRRG